MHIISIARINSSAFATAVFRPTEIFSEPQWKDKVDQTHIADLSRRSECSLNLRISGSAPRCFPACIVISFSFPVYKIIVKLTHVWKGPWKVKFRTSSWSPRVASRSMNMSTSSSRGFLGSSSNILCWQDPPGLNKGSSPSSGFSRYLSKIASSLTTCWVAVERMEARCEWKSFD